jgi:hypothetical protein
VQSEQSQYKEIRELLILKKWKMNISNITFQPFFDGKLYASEAIPEGRYSAIISSIVLFGIIII